MTKPSTAVGSPAIRDELLAVLSEGVSLLVGTADASGTPHTLRAVGLRLHDDGLHGTVYLPEVTCRNTVTDVAANPRVALMVSQPLTHRSVQVKGAVTGVSHAPEAERPLVEAYLAGFARVLESLGMPLEVVSMLSHWPAIALEFRLDELFTQTPGPGAGARISGTP